MWRILRWQEQEKTKWTLNIDIRIPYILDTFVKALRRRSWHVHKLVRITILNSIYRESLSFITQKYLNDCWMLWNEITVIKSYIKNGEHFLFLYLSLSLSLSPQCRHVNMARNMTACDVWMHDNMMLADDYYDTKQATRASKKIRNTKKKEEDVMLLSRLLHREIVLCFVIVYKSKILSMYIYAVAVTVTNLRFHFIMPQMAIYHCVIG